MMHQEILILEYQHYQDIHYQEYAVLYGFTILLLSFILILMIGQNVNHSTILEYIRLYKNLVIETVFFKIQFLWIKKTV